MPQTAEPDEMDDDEEDENAAGVELAHNPQYTPVKTTEDPEDSGAANKGGEYFEGVYEVSLPVCKIV
jgi:hypothetical protein